MISLLMGMISAAFVTRSFDLKWFNLKVAIRHLFAGIFMGCGASIAGGGNDSQLLVAMPSLSLAGLATVASIVVGIFLGLKMFSRASI
ncbi:YeeE/YedE thiosulfate transporter family protein [Vibrio sinaloensis]|uniref:YeeE/YedE thiosulfate transporter family protein n=2 Tax=Photobacterium sp. (strain ATCC 43367) TaxID=379097 RepID=UPI002F423CA3